MKALYVENNVLKILLLSITSKIFKYAALYPPAPARYAEVGEPQIPGPDWIKIKNKSCGLCGTDIHLIFMDMDPKIFPAATPGIYRKYLGHEMIGEVVETGSNVNNYQKGDRVCLRIDWPSCFQMEINPMCRQCQAGNYMLCENLGKKTPPTEHTGAGFAPYMIMHHTQPFKIPDALTDDEAVLLEPTAVAVHGVLKQKPKPGDKVLVIGCGTIGLLIISAVKAIEPQAEIIAIARYDFQSRIAKKMGANDVFMGSDSDMYEKISAKTDARYHKGYFGNKILLGGFDVVYDSIGNNSSINNALRWTRAGGNIVILGINFRPGKIDYSPLWHQEINLTGTNCHIVNKNGEDSFELAANFLAEKKIDAQGIITHRFPMDNYRDAVKTFLAKGKHGAIKIVLDHHQ
ncbi:MAG: alcohol dehydrogenase catalytic domain-containing protein [Deltaproteobacteria bacterium]|nr:alcohol dehydrogenase catalytic domain-containing protein [Deltaproteobacteria bacterium]